MQIRQNPKKIVTVMPCLKNKSLTKKREHFLFWSGNKKAIDLGTVTEATKVYQLIPPCTPRPHHHPLYFTDNCQC